ncbi:hypothetical protein Tco_1102172 [Tanacetum coccineum]
MAGTNWSCFINISGYGDIATLHFIWEGADTFCVTEYDEHGSEIGGYNDLMMQQRRSRILVTLGNNPGESSEKLKHCFDFTNDKRVVLTNMLGNDLRVLVFRDDGYEINHENLPCTKVILDTMVKKETHKGQGSCVLPDSRHVKNEGSLVIPPDFMTANDLFIFEHDKIVSGKKSDRLELRQEFYNDDPSRVNDMKLVRNWRRISRRCMFGKNKTIRLKYLTDMLDKRVVKTCGQDPVMNPINGYDAMLEDLGIKDGSILFSRFRIPGKSLDEGLVPLMSNQDVLSLLHYVPIYKEIKVYAEKNTMEVFLGTGKGVVIEEVMEDDEVKEASETGNSGKKLLLVTENDVQTKTEPLTPPWSFESLSDFDISDHPPWSSKSMNEKRNKGVSEDFQFRKMLFDIDLTFGLDFSHETLEMKNEVKAEQEMEEPVHNDFHPLMYEDDLLQKEDPVNYQPDPYHGEDESEENA